jgi:hypothetical protein
MSASHSNTPEITTERRSLAYHEACRRIPAARDGNALQGTDLARGTLSGVETLTYTLSRKHQGKYGATVKDAV